MKDISADKDIGKGTDEAIFDGFSVEATWRRSWTSYLRKYRPSTKEQKDARIAREEARIAREQAQEFLDDTRKRDKRRERKEKKRKYKKSGHVL